MESVLPSEIARLVYGYLEAEGCGEAARNFLETSPHLEECLKVAQEGRRFSTRIQGRTLVQTLDLFFNINSLIQERVEKLTNTSGNNTSLSLGTANNNSLIEQLIGLLDGTNTSVINRSSSNNTNTVLLSITVPSQDDTNIRVRQHSSGKHRQSVDGDLPKSKEKTVQYSSNMETQKSKKDDNVEDEPVIDLSCGEELLTRLLDNTQLHEKIAENINKAISTPEKTAPDNGKDVIQTILKETEADPLFEQLIKELVGPAEEDSTTPEDTEFEDGHLRNGSVEPENEDESSNIKQRLRSAKSKASSGYDNKNARDVLEEQNASAVQSILDSSHTKHRKQDSNSEQVNTDRSESDKENENNQMNTTGSETNCSNLLQTAMMNCDINSSPLGTSGERSKTKVDGELKSSSDHQPPMDLCFIDVGQLSPQNTHHHHHLEPSLQEKASSMLLIQSDNLPTTSAESGTSGSQIIIPPSLCPNVLAVQPGYANVLTVLAPSAVGAAPTMVTSTPAIQNRSIPTVLLYEDFLRIQAAHSPIGTPTLLQTPTSVKQYKPIAPKPTATSESTTVPACSSSVTTSTSIGITSETAVETNEPKSSNTTATPIVCSEVNDAQTPPTVAPVRSGRGWRREWKGVLKKKFLRRSPKFKKILPKRPPVRNFLNVREQRLVNGVEVKVLDYDATGEETLPNVETEEPAETEGPKIEVISETKIQVEMDITDNTNNEVNVGDIVASKDTSSEKPCVNSEELFANDTNKNSNDTPELPLSKKGLSLSTPRRKYTHVRALDFNTPPKGIIKRSNTSPKAAHRWSPRKNFMRNAKRSALFRSPTSNKTRKKFGAGEITKQQNLSVVNESEEHMSVCVKEDVHMPANGTPMKEVLPNDRSLLPPVATMSPATKLCGDWGKVNGVELILCSTNKETANKSWDADLRALAGGQFQDPSPPPKKCLSLKKDNETALNKTVSPKNKNVRIKSNHDNRVANKDESMNEKSVGEKKVVDSRVPVTKTKNQNKNTKKGKAKAQPARKKNIKGKSKEKDAQEKTYLSKEFISDTESSDLNESKRELPSKINEQNNDNEKEKSISSESGVLMVDDPQENLNKSSLSETEIARQLEENIRQIVGDELSSERTEQNSAISAEDIRQVLESSKEFGETDKKKNEENEVVSNLDNDKDNRKSSNDTTDQNNITPTDIVSNEKSLSKSLLQNLPSVGALPVLETPVKLDFVGVVPKTPNLDTPMLKIIRENTSVLSADLLLTPFAQTPLQSSSAVADQTPFKDISPNCNVSSGTSNLEQELIKECCRMEEEIAMKKSVEIKDKIVDHNEKALNSDENLNKSQRTSVEDKKLMNETSSVEISKIVSVDNSDKMVSAVNTSKEDSVEDKIDPGQKHVTSSENKIETSCKGNKNSCNNLSETQNTPESNIETRVEEPFDFPRKSKYHVKLDKSKVKTTRTQNKGKCNGKNKISSCEKSVVNMKIDSTESIRQKLVREARQEIYGESSISSSDFSISELKKHKRQRRSKVYPIIYTDESSADIPCSKTFPSRRRSNRKTKKSNISVSGSSDRSDIESINAEREHQCTSGILSTVTSTPVKIDSHEQSRVYKAGDQSTSPKDISKEDGLSALHSGQYKTACKEKSDRCTKADVKLLEQPKVILTPLKRTQTRQAEKPKDEEKNIKNTISDSAEVGISFKTIPHIPDSIKALAESSQSPKKIINTLESSQASNKINTDAVEVETQPDVVNTETDLEKQNENSSDFPPLHLSPEREDEDDCHSEVSLNIVEEDAVLSPAKKISVLENDLELSSTVPEKRNFPINFLSETEEYHLTEFTFNESNNDDTENKMSDIGCRIVKHEIYEEVYFDESKYVPKPKKVNNIDNFQMKIFLDEDENGIQKYCKLSVQPLQNLFEMRPIKVTEASQADSNLHEKKCPSSDSKIAGKKVDGNVSEKQLETSAHINTPHAQYKYSKDLKYSGRSPSSTKSEYSINRSKLSEPYRNWRASSTKAMLVTRTSDGRKRIAPVRLDDYDYERRQRRMYDNSERRKSYDRQRERDRDKDVDRNRESERYRDRESERYRDQREFDRESERYRDRECERHRDRDFERYRDRDRELDRDRDRENEKHRGRDRELDRDCYKESEKYRDGERDIDRQRDSDRVRHREVDRYRERSRRRSREIDKDRDEDGEVRSRQSGDHARDRSCERRKSDRESESDNRTRELSEARCPKNSEEFQKRELITYDDVYPHKSSDAEEGQCTDDDDDDLMNQVIISKTLSPRKKGNETTAHSTVGTPSKLPPKKRKASDDISVGPIKIARTEEPQALLKKVDLEKFLTAVHGDEASTAGTST